jgi:AraC-like DNA-binding protein/mannose-6-phosphate isomerase-like protein (cupin superfamily)
MDFSRFLSPRRLPIQEDGKYLYALSPELPIDLVLYRFDRAYPSVPNYHDHYEVSHILRGQGSCRIGGEVHRCERGDILALGPGVFHFVEPAGKPALETLALYFAAEAVHAPGAWDADLEYLVVFTDSQAGRTPRMTLESEGQAKVMEQMSRIGQELAQRRDFHRVAVKNALCEILLLLSRSRVIRRTPAAALRVPLRDAHRLRPVFAMIREGYMEQIDHSGLARAAEMTPAAFSRYFRKVTGHTVTEYIARFRVDKAKELLLSSDHEVTWIAHEVGFQSHSYFDHVFRTVAGLTPQDFRTLYAPSYIQDV